MAFIRAGGENMEDDGALLAYYKFRECIGFSDYYFGFAARSNELRCS